MTDEGETGWRPVLEFDSDAPEFCRGFEAGVLWARIQTERHISATIHGTNAEMVMRMAEATGWNYRADSLDGDWLSIELSMVPA